jgi:hypothetical protein
MRQHIDTSILGIQAIILSALEDSASGQYQNRARDTANLSRSATCTCGPFPRSLAVIHWLSPTRVGEEDFELEFAQH